MGLQQHRVGKIGIRPVGSRESTHTKVIQSEGRRLQAAPGDKASLATPHQAVYSWMATWFRRKREYNHEVRKSHVLERSPSRTRWKRP